MMRYASTLLSLTLGVVLLVVGTGCETPEPEPEAAEAEAAGHVLLADKDADKLFFIHPQTYAVEDTIEVGRGPHEVAVHETLRRAYVANYEGEEGIVSIIDLDDREEITRVGLDSHGQPHGIEVSPDEDWVGVTVEADRAVVGLHPARGDVQWTVETEQDVTHMLAIAPDSERLYTANIGSGTATAIDIEDREVIDHIETGAGAEGIALTPDGSELWVANREDDTVSIVDPETLEVIDTLEVEGFPLRVYMTHDGSTALVSCARAGEVAVVDVENRDVIDRVATGEAPIGVQITPDDERAFVGNMHGGTVSVIDLETLDVIENFDLGEGPDGMAFAPAE